MAEIRERLLSPKDVAEWFGVPVATVYRWHTDQIGPVPRKVGKHLRYVQSECKAWLDSRVTADARR